MDKIHKWISTNGNLYFPFKTRQQTHIYIYNTLEYKPASKLGHSSTKSFSS